MRRRRGGVGSWRTLSAAVRHPPAARLWALLVGAGMAYAAFAYESGYNDQRPPVLAVPPPAVAPARGPARRLVWVLIDGLRLDASRGMPVLNRLRAEGLDVTARAEFPTFSGPNLVAQASGLEPAAAGVLSNSYPGEVALDSVFRRAKLAGLRTAVLTTDDDSAFTWTYGSWVDATVIDDPEVRLPPSDLAFVHVGFVDETGHDYGAVSPEYRAAVGRADDVVARVLGTLDPARDVLVVTSDHGNLPEGGHGGTEPVVVAVPIVVWGAGIAPGRGVGRGRDVGPTIAALLGIAPLGHATGRPLVGGDAATKRQRDVVRTAVWEARRLRVAHLSFGIPLAVAALLLLGTGARAELRHLAASPVYAVVFAALVVATGTTSFSVSNLPAWFGPRLTALGALAALAQLLLGGRRSLVPAAIVASVAALGTTVVAAFQPVAPADGTLRFLPIPALTGLAFLCIVAAAVGWHAGESPARGLATPAPADDERGLLGLPGSGTCEEPRLRA